MAFSCPQNPKMRSAEKWETESASFFFSSTMASAPLLPSLLFPFPLPLAVLLVARPPVHEHSGRARRRASACRVRRGGGTGSEAECAHKWFYSGHEEALLLASMRNGSATRRKAAQAWPT